MEVNYMAFDIMEQFNPNARAIRPTRVRYYSEQVAPGGFDLAIGDLRPPEFYTPAHIRAAAVQALERGETYYPPVRGIAPLRTAIAEKYQGQGLPTVSENILVTTGATEALFCAVMSVIHPGDEVLVPDPAHDIYLPMLSLAQAVPVPYYCGIETGYLPDPDEIRRLVGPRTRALWLNTPYSPTGQVMGSEVTQALVQIAESHGLWLLADETYDRYVFDGAKHTSFLTYNAVADRVLVASAFSKSYAMTGWRIGYLVGPPEAIEVAAHVHRNVVSGVNTLAQWAGIAALKGDQSCVDGFVQALSESRRIVINAVKQMKGVRTVEPQGTFYLYLHVQGTGFPADQLADQLVARGIATVPGSNWGTRHAEDYLRLSFSHQSEYMVRAMRAMQDALPLA